MSSASFRCERLFDGAEWHDDVVIHVENGMITALEPTAGLSGGASLDGMVVPGFVDLQVNGGGGTLLNDAPTRESIETICSAHWQFGTTALLPTLITDTREVTAAAIAAGSAAAGKVPGFAGLHLEGPHLSLARKGAHDPALVRPMENEDLQLLVAARAQLPNLLVTVAAETVIPDQIRALADAGIIVSIGHSDAGFDTANAAIDAGARMVTHLFNAMSQMGHREPGLVGAALARGEVYAGLIADGIHVHPQAIKIALAAKQGPGRIFLVTDAMSQTGTDIRELTLNGRQITRANGALRLADGTLAGADLDMIDAVAFMHREIGLGLEEALKMASFYPAQAIGLEGHGQLIKGSPANFVQLSSDLAVRSTVIGGEQLFSA
ncbi:N-acetylglucosamine-6-phosphate deacetylase [Devosia pacifica]|uniref:N-acetylglucosamine-6-phosphate deacetylase n=1 Tax=Devosia pacifica TaxID=1335967 RepID=A0A918SFL3_9HYPH|nr:N-acetylglucosamine-6-phosphate deacetylase [Devosia pacifica]GHA36239.1 N-acetylglucosamine-6-phosphate deacetylase [Devosia pacifica]